MDAVCYTITLRFSIGAKVYQVFDHIRQIFGLCTIDHLGKVGGDKASPSHEGPVNIVFL